MSLTTEQRTSRLFKSLMGVGETNVLRSFYEEGFQGRPLIFASQVWKEERKIPSTAPVLLHGEISGVVQYLEDVPLTLVAGTNNSYYSESLKNSIPFNFDQSTGSYNYVLKDNFGNQIYYGQGDWLVDNLAGLLTFYGIVPSNMPPTISFYKYIGEVGVGDIESEIVDIKNTIWVGKNGLDTNSGKLGKPVLTVQKAIDIIISNADNSLLNPYEIRIGPGVYNENLILENDKLLSIEIEGSGSIVTALTATSGKSVQSESSNDDLSKITIKNIVIEKDVSIIGASAGTNLGLQILSFEDSKIEGNFYIENANYPILHNVDIEGTLTYKNVALGTITGNSKILGDFIIATDNSTNKPSAWLGDSIGSTLVISDSIIVNDPTYTLLNNGKALVQLRNGVRYGITGGTFPAGLTVQAYDSILRGTYVNNGNLTLYGSFVSGDLTGNAPILEQPASQIDNDSSVAGINVKEALDNLKTNLVLLGAPTDGSYTDGLLSFSASTKIPDAVDEINEILNKLAPPKPSNLSDKILSMSGFYSATESNTGNIHDDCIDNTTPLASVSNFYDGDAGIVSCEIDSIISGSITLSTASDVGSNDALIITEDSDPYVGQPGKENFWKQLSAQILPTISLTYNEHTYKLIHSNTGSTPLIYFHVDDPQNTTISSVSHNLPVSTIRYISGVPSLSSGDLIDLDFTVNNAVHKHYNSTRLAYISSSYTTNTSLAPPVTPPSEGSAVSYTNKTVSINNNVYSENVSITLRGYNSKNISGSVYTEYTGARVDTVSNESIRKISGTGQFPISGYGGVYNSNYSLKGTYTSELQMINGNYQVPSGNYSTNLPTIGPDYSVGIGTSYRYVTFQPTYFSNVSSFTLNINNASGTWSGIETTDIRIYIKIEGITGWLNANSSYPGVGTPVGDDDSAMVYASSSSVTKQITFGGVTRSGSLYIRIGLPYTSNKKFTGISVTNIV